MSSERRIAANRKNGRSSGPRTKAGKIRASRNALRHGLAVISHDQSIPSGEIARLAKALCGDDSDPALLAQAQVIAQNAMVLRAIREQQTAVVTTTGTNGDRFDETRQQSQVSKGEIQASSPR
jgi:hypothetical protein